jgi:3-oxoacyl-[acyl-carrier protein] reductase
MNTLTGRKAIVTGGARGIGRAITKQLLKDGSSVLICSRNKKELEKTCKELDASGKKLFSFVADVSIYTDCGKLFKYAEKLFNRLDILVNNAGIYGPIGLLERNAPEEWAKTIHINLLGTVYCTKLALPQMKKQKRGKIINLAGAGVGGQKPLGRFSAYYTSKAAVAAFTEVIASEVSEDNIQINCISPGAINTYFVDYLLSQDPKQSGPMYEQALETKRTGGDSLEPTARLVSFLSSDESRNVTGKILSAKWDKIEALKKITKANKNMLTLRRIDEELFSEKK